jgi:hypothetical protein
VVVLVAGLVDMLTTRPINKEIPQILWHYATSRKVEGSIPDEVNF